MRSLQTLFRSYICIYFCLSMSLVFCVKGDDLRSDRYIAAKREVGALLSAARHYAKLHQQDLVGVDQRDFIPANGCDLTSAKPMNSIEFRAMEVSVYQENLLPPGVQEYIRLRASSDFYIQDPVPTTILLHCTQRMRPGLVAKKIADLLGADFREFPASRFKSQYDLIRSLEASRGKEEKPIVVFVSEITNIGRDFAGKREKNWELMLNQLCRVLKKIKRNNHMSQQQIYVVASTIAPDALTNEVREQFDQILEIPAPSCKARLDVLRHVMGCLAGGRVAVDLESIARDSEGFEFEDLMLLAKTSVRRACQLGSHILEQDHLIFALNKVQKDVVRIRAQEEKSTASLFADDRKEEVVDQTIEHDGVPINFSTIADELVPEQVKFLVRKLKEEKRRERRYRISLPKAVLLYGPTGSGKTTIAQAIAGEVKAAKFKAVSCTKMIDCLLGGSAGNIRQLFQGLQESLKGDQKGILFLDEVEAIASARGDGGYSADREYNSMVTTLLTLMRGCDTHENIIVIAATNHPGLLDPAFLGRFSHKIEIALPDKKARRSVLLNRWEHLIGQEEPLPDFDYLAEKTEGFSCADLASLLQSSAMYADSADAHVIEHDHIQKALEEIHRVLPSRVFAVPQDVQTMFC